jgi:hypothetical protein
MVEGGARFGDENMKHYLPLNFNGRLSPVDVLTELTIAYQHRPKINVTHTIFSG